MYPGSSDGSGIAAVSGVFILIWAIIGLAITVFAVLIWWRIFSKAGYSGAMGLLIFIPIANIIVLCVLAFAEWPIMKELNQLRQMAAQRQQYPNQQYPNQQFPNQQFPQQFPNQQQYPNPNPQYPRN